MNDRKNTKRTHHRPRTPATTGPLSTCPDRTNDARTDRPDVGFRYQKRQTNSSIAAGSPRTPAADRPSLPPSASDRGG